MVIIDDVIQSSGIIADHLFNLSYITTTLDVTSHSTKQRYFIQNYNDVTLLLFNVRVAAL